MLDQPQPQVDTATPAEEENGLRPNKRARTCTKYPAEVALDQVIAAALPREFVSQLREIVTAYAFDPAPEQHRLKMIEQCKAELASIQQNMEVNKWEDCNGIISDLSKQEAAKKAEIYDLEHPEEAAAKRAQEERVRLANTTKYYRASSVERRLLLVGGGESIDVVWNFYRLASGEEGMDMRQLPANVAARLRNLDRLVVEKQEVEGQQEETVEKQKKVVEQQNKVREELAQMQKRLADIKSKQAKK